MKFQNPFVLTLGRLLALTIAALAAGTLAQAQPATGPKTVGAGILHLNVVSLEASLALYRDVLGMEVTTPVGAPRSMPNLVKEPGAMMRIVVLKVPGGAFSMELIEWQGTPLKPQKLRIQDPGAIMLAVNIKDMNAAMAGVQKLGLKVLSKGGAPLPDDQRGPGARTVMVQDPDGYVVELLEGFPDKNLPATPGQINGVGIYVSVLDLAQTVSYYNTVYGFGMPAPPEARQTPERIVNLFNDPSLKTVRMARAQVPGSQLTLNFQEFGVPGRTPTRHRVQDAGGPVMILNVAEADFPKVMALVPANGGIIGSGDKSEAVAPDARASWTRDPNGILQQVSVPRAPAPSAPVTRPL